MANRILKTLEEIRLYLHTGKAVLNIDEVAAFTSMSKSAIYKLTSSKKIPHYKQSEGAKALYFKRKEILDWMTSYKVKTIDEMAASASLSIAPKKKKK